MAESRRYVEEEKRRLAAEIKESRFKLAGDYTSLRAAENLMKRARAEEERIRKDRLRKKLDNERLAKERRAKEDYDARVEWERSKRCEIEAMLTRLEQEEKDLVKRLRKTQELQEEAYLFLQRSLES